MHAAPVQRPSSGAFAAHIAALTTAAPFTNRLLQYITHYMSSLARSGTVDRGRAQRARYLGEDDPSDLDDDDSSDARVTMEQETPEPPEPPLLELDACGLVVKFTPPSGATLAKLLLHAEGGLSDEARYYSPKTKSFVAARPWGFPIELGTGQQQVVAEDGLVEGKVSVTIGYRSANMEDCAARSNTLELARPAKPCAPQVKPCALKDDRALVSFALPALSFKASVKVEVTPPERGVLFVAGRHVDAASIVIDNGAEGGGNVYHVVPSSLAPPQEFKMSLAPAAIVSHLVPGLSSPPNAFIGADRFGQGCFEVILPNARSNQLPGSDGFDYHISVAAFNGVAWSDFGPATTVSDWFGKAFIAPSAPTLTEIGEDCVRVNFTSPPYDHEFESINAKVKMKVVMRVVAGGPVLYYNGDGGLICTTDANFNEKTCQLDSSKVTSCVVGGLAPNTEYEVNVLAVNDVGDGPESDPTRFKTLPSEVEVTGVQTADERDEEAKKHAIDVDAADQPVAKRVKSEP